MAPPPDGPVETGLVAVRGGRRGRPRYWQAEAGTVIAARFEVVRELGKGAWGTVFECVDRRLERNVALKLLAPDLVEREDIVARFHREAAAPGKIAHPHICDVRDLGETPSGVPFIVMELLVGETLEEVLAREHCLSFEQMADVLTQVLDGLGAAHDKGVVHRDLKPSNIFLCGNGDGLGQVKLLDFGISKFLSVDLVAELTPSGAVMGTPGFMSPEQASGEKALDHRADVWSAGVVLYHGLTGRLPFDGANFHALMVSILTAEPDPVRRIDQRLPEGIDEILQRALAKNPAARYSNVAEFRAAIQSLRSSAATELTVEEVSAAADPVPGRAHAEQSSRGLEPARRLASYNPLVLGCIGIALIGPILVAGGIYLLLWRQQPTQPGAEPASSGAPARCDCSSLDVSGAWSGTTYSENGEVARWTVNLSQERCALGGTSAWTDGEGDMSAESLRGELECDRNFTLVGRDILTGNEEVYRGRFSGDLRSLMGEMQTSAGVRFRGTKM